MEETVLARRLPCAASGSMRPDRTLTRANSAATKKPLRSTNTIVATRYHPMGTECATASSPNLSSSSHIARKEWREATHECRVMGDQLRVTGDRTGKRPNHEPTSPNMQRPPSDRECGLLQRLGQRGERHATERTLAIAMGAVVNMLERVVPQTNDGAESSVQNLVAPQPRIVQQYISIAHDLDNLGDVVPQLLVKMVLKTQPQKKRRNPLRPNTFTVPYARPNVLRCLDRIGKQSSFQMEFR